MTLLKNNTGSWHTMYLILFYVSMSFCLIFVYLIFESYELFGVDGSLFRTLFNNETTLSKSILIIFAAFFVLNTVYLIRRKE